MQGYASETANGAFADSSARFGTMVDWLSGEQAAGMTHAEMEERLHADGMRLLCQLLQDSLDSFQYQATFLHGDVVNVHV